MIDQRIFSPFFLDQEFTDLDNLIEADWIVNRPQLPHGGVQERMLAVYEPLATVVESAVLAGSRPVSIAGDCCASLGMFAGLQRAGVKPTLIWFDAHGDFNTWETSPSGFLGGMPLAWLVGRGEQRIPHGLGITPLPESDVTLTDARDLDPLEAEAVESSAVNHLSEVSDLTHAPLPIGPIWVHFDVDVIDLAEAPAVSYPAEGGPSKRILGDVFQALAESRQVKAVSVSLWNPQLDRDGQTQRVVLSLLQKLLA
ncbi:MAG: arginase family protein [Candidatus Promineifilaceae bacterium]|jgi:arginase